MKLRENKELQTEVRNAVDWICETGPVVRDGITEKAIEERLWELLDAAQKAETSHE
jgi:hypothetical protein